MSENEEKPGLIVLFGSGETSASGRKVFDQVMRQIPAHPRVALLETPAGFELNSAQVIGRVGDFIRERLQNYAPQVEIVPARRRGTPFSPDTPEVVAPLFLADLVFMGPGSPTYAVRQLRGSLAWQALQASHRLGAAVVFASAAVVAASLFSIPVYEVYKVGEDLHWKDGLDFFGLYGLPLVFVPHWNNTDGGAELDTSRCFMGKGRFAQLMEMIPSELTVVGIDEKTALIMDPQKGACHVAGAGGVTLIHTGPAHQSASSPIDLEGSGLIEIASRRKAHVHIYHTGEIFPLNKIGEFHLPPAGVGLPPRVWEHAVQARRERDAGKNAAEAAPAEVLALIKLRQEARSQKDWAASDRLRDQVALLGWQVQDTPEGPKVTRLAR